MRKRLRPIEVRSIFLFGLIACFVLKEDSVTAQEISPVYSAAIQTADSNTVGYTLNNNTSRWRVGISHAGSHGNADYAISERYTATRLEFGEDEARWKDDQRLSIGFEMPMTKRLKFSANALSSIFKDRHTGLFNDTETRYIQAGLRYEFLPAVRVRSSVGPIKDSRREQSDSGFRYATSFKSYRLPISEWHGSADGVLSGDRLGRRVNEDRQFRLELGRVFNNFTSDSLTFRWGEKRRDYYISEAGEIESRNQTTNRIRNSLRYRLSSSLSLRWLTAFSRAKTDIESPFEGLDDVIRTRRDDMTLNTLSLGYRSPTRVGVLTLGFRSALQKYGAFTENGSPGLPRIAPDNRAETVRVGGRMDFLPTASDSVRLSASSSRLRYNTPDEANEDDRDELRLYFDAGLTHRFAPDFRLAVKGNANLDHVVYLFSHRSADNHWNRVFALNTEVNAKLSRRARTRQRFGVLANYYDYDYEDLFATTRSLLLRNFTYAQKTDFTIGDVSAVVLATRIELEEDGKLDWSEFLEQRVATRRISSVEVRWSYTRKRSFIFSAGINRSSRLGWRYAYEGASPQKVEELIGLGPVFLLRWLSKGSVVLSLKGKVQRVENIYGTTYYTKSVQLYTTLRR